PRPLAIPGSPRTRAAGSEFVGLKYEPVQQPGRRQVQPRRAGSQDRLQCDAQDPKTVGLLRKLRRTGLLNDDRRGPCGRPAEIGRSYFTSPPCGEAGWGAQVLAY